MSEREDPLQTELWKELLFEVAAWKWLEGREGNIKPKTHHEYKLNIHTLVKFFRPYKLREITSESIREYQKKRQKEGVGYSGINHETCVLQMILRRAGLWGEISLDFHPIPPNVWQPGRVISTEDKDRLLRHGASNDGWAAALYYTMISVNTSAGPSEVMCLRLKDVLLNERCFQICEGAKNKERIRPIPLDSEEAYEGMRLALERARRLGSSEPDHYLFPWRDKATKKYDPRKHQTSFKWAWKRMVEAAGMPNLNPYDLRRTCITNMLCDPRIPLEVIRKFAGHVGYEMIRYYSYRRMDAMRKAQRRLNRAPGSGPKRKPPQREAETFPVSLPRAAGAQAGAQGEEKKQKILALMAELLDVNG